MGGARWGWGRWGGGTIGRDRMMVFLPGASAPYLGKSIMF